MRCDDNLRGSIATATTSLQQVCNPLTAPPPRIPARGLLSQLEAVVQGLCPSSSSPEFSRQGQQADTGECLPVTSGETP